MSARVCSGCRVLLPADAFTTPHVYECRPCRNAAQRARYVRRVGKAPRQWRRQPPPEFAARAGKEWDVDIARDYGVSYRTIQRWRRLLGIPPKDRRPHMAAWGQLGNRVARELHPERMTGFERTRKANAARAAREIAADVTGITRPTIRTPHLGDDRALLTLAMQAFSRAGSRVTEEDYA